MSVWAAVIKKTFLCLVPRRQKVYQTIQTYFTMNIQILGTGCPKCKSLENATREVVSQNGIEATITKVEDIMEIMKFNVMTTPALVIDGKVVVKGRVPSNNELKEILTNKI